MTSATKSVTASAGGSVARSGTDGGGGDGAAPDREAVRRVRAAVRGALAPYPRGGVVLAVSGGRDSMVLLDAACAVARDRLAGVATFDHGSGPHAAAAVRHVRRAARRLGLRVVRGRAALPDASEAAWREARWRFLRRAARRLGAAVVATAHTADDQVETVAIRLLRGAGPRGLAGLLAAAPGIARPLVGCTRTEVAAYAAARRVRWVEDAGNVSLRVLRNRLRHQLLPALERTRPGTAAWLLDLGRRAAAWRADAEALAADFPTARLVDGALHVAGPAFRGYDAARLGVLWPALSARAGVRLDRRGTARLVAFTTRVAAEAAVPGAAIPLAGGAEAVVRRGSCVPAVTELVVRRVARRGAGPGPAPIALGADGGRFGEWVLRPAAADPSGETREDPWSATLPAGADVVVRAWRPGDRMRLPARRARVAGAARRVKRYLADARIPGTARAGWPVVVVRRGGEEEIVWIPGVCRSDAATDRPETPGQRYICERIERQHRRGTGRGRDDRRDSTCDAPRV